MAKIQSGSYGISIEIDLIIKIFQFQLKRKKVNGCITSMCLHTNDTVVIGTETCEIYTLDYRTFILKLQITCHSSTVYDIAFPM